MDELLTYRQLLYLLSLHFGKREFDTSEASRAILSDLEGADPAHLITSRFRPKLMSNGLRRLRSYELVEPTRRVPREVVTKSGKKHHRGFQYMWRITPKGLRYLKHVSVKAFDTRAISERLLVAYAERTIPKELLAIAPPAMLPPTLKKVIQRRTRLPNRVTFQKEANQLAEAAESLVQAEMKRQLKELRVQREIREKQEQYAKEVAPAARISAKLKEDSERASEERARETARVIAENEAKKARIGDEFLTKLEPLMSAAGDIFPEAKELMKRFLSEQDLKGEDSSESRNDKPDTSDGEST